MALPLSSHDSAPQVKPGAEARALFPFFRRGAVAYLDSAATAQKSARVVQRLSSFLNYENANIHRGAYTLSAAATAEFEKTRSQLARFINAPDSQSVVFTRGATEAINLVAASFGATIPEGSAILLTLLEHHSNIVPWQMLAKRRNLRVEFAGITPHGELDIEDFKRKLSSLRPALCAVTQLSNVTGAAPELSQLIEAAHAAGARVLVDAAQGAPHLPIDVAALDVDFLAFSAHKLYGPTGIGCLYARREILEKMEPVQGGGGMIETVRTSGSTWAPVPQRFEAGTQAIAEAVAWQEALHFVEEIGLAELAAHEEALVEAAVEQLSREPGVVFYGPCAAGRAQSSILSFNVAGVHAHDLATIADSCGVQIRAGHHCAMPLMQALGVSATARASFAAYSVPEDVEQLVEAVRRARKILG